MNFYVEFYSKKYSPVSVKFFATNTWSVSKIRKELKKLGYDNVSISYISGLRG
jgi:hypothetical protein